MPARSARPAWAAPLLVAFAAGCFSSVAPTLTQEEAAEAGWTRVEGVPVVRQTSRQGCGAAALAMVLGFAGHPVRQEDVWAAGPPARGRGLRADALRDFARRQGLRAFLVEGKRADLERELAGDRPVLVGVVKRRLGKAYPHYEVVVGLDRQRRRILTLDPAHGPRERAWRVFDREWAAAGRLTLVVLTPRPPPQPSVAPASRSSSRNTAR